MTVSHAQLTGIPLLATTMNEARAAGEQRRLREGRADRASRQARALPIYPELTEEQQSRIVRTIGEFFRA
jgi:dTDP-4-amino-4,6-dideoxygalactose transaminase